MDSLPQLYLVTYSKLLTAADFHIEIPGCKMNSLFNTGAQVSCIPYDCYREFTLKTKIDTNVKAKLNSTNSQNVGPI